MLKKNPSVLGIASLFLVSALALCIHAFSYHFEMTHTNNHDKAAISKIVKDATFTTNISNA
ncbi:hypothetical protein OAO18_01775 [Francisellaceae bacterium]|nr:hypothetical protein [Francisellaceae bacterium]